MANQRQADLVIERFGSISRLSEEIGESEDKIRNWRRSGFIPQKYHLRIAQAAQRIGVALMPHDFVAWLVMDLFASTGDSQTSGAVPADAG